MKLTNSNRLIYFILALGFIAGIIVIFFAQISYGGVDNYSHYKLPIGDGNILNYYSTIGANLHLQY